MIAADELRKKYLEFFKEKGHAIIPSASLVPENDPTVLFTTAGMHPLVPYLMGENHPKGKRLANVQKCIRTIDIDEVGDTTHHTFFEMLGNWSLGDYFKKEAIEWSWEFLTSKKWLGLDKNKIAVSVFAGDENAEFDQESYDIWRKIFEENNLPVERIAKLPKENNWWGPAGEAGPCGPDTEMFYWVGAADKVPKKFNDDSAVAGWVEIWNDVFMEYNKKIKSEKLKVESEKKEYEYVKLSQQNVDTGMGLERILAVMNGYDDNYRTELFWPIIEKIEEISGKKYEDNEETKKAIRIIADHLKAAVFIIADSVEPSNLGRGYVVRRLLRRSIGQGHFLCINDKFISRIAEVIQSSYKNVYPEITGDKILSTLSLEEDKFSKTLARGMAKFEIFAERKEEGKPFANAKDLRKKKAKELEDYLAFDLYQTDGFTLEMIIEKAKEELIPINEIELKKNFAEQFKQHQELSRTASAGMFKGGLADTKEKTTQLHTVAHLMLAGLRKVLGAHVHQKGSNINGERIRFDFSHPEKMTDEQKKAVEDFVNEAIGKKIEVKMEEMGLEEAKKSGAEGAFESKYGDVVKVYSIAAYSREICGGPHVKNTGDIKGVFKIKKEESSSAGVRRIKAVVG